MALYISALKYILVFTIALCFFILSEQEFRCCNSDIKHKGFLLSKRKLKASLLALIGILIICIFAAIRAEDVGTDTSGYPISFMNLAKSCDSLSSLLKMESDLTNEPLGAILVYFCSLFTSKSWLLLFFYQFFTIVPVFLAALQFKDNLSITDSMAVYLLMFFNNSLNMMRQSVGCALILLGVALIITKKSLLKSYLCFFMAILFHRASLYGVILILVVYYSFNISKKKIKYLLYLLVILIPVFITSIANIVSKFISDVHILYYIDVFVTGKVEKDWFVNPFSFYSLVYILVAICLLFMPIMFNSNLFKNIRKLNIGDDIGLIQYKFSSLNLLGFLMYSTILFSMKTMYGIRFSIFFDFVYMLSIPLSIKRHKSYRKIMYILLLICWFIWIIRMGWSGSELYHIGI